MWVVEDIPTVLDNFPIQAWVRISIKDYEHVVLSIILGGFPFYSVQDLGSIHVGEIVPSEAAKVGTVQGTVIDAQTNEGLRDLRIYIYSGLNINQYSSPINSIVLMDQYYFQFKELIQGAYAIRVEKDGYTIE